MTTPDPLVLLISCPDRPGIVAAVAQALFDHGANILDLDHHTDASADRFFARFRFAPGPAGPGPTGGDGSGALRAAIAELGARFGMDLRLTSEADRKRLVVFVSRLDHCLWDLLLRHRAGELPCEVPLVVSNHSDLAPVAAQFGIPFEEVPVTAAGKAEAEARERALLAEVGADVVVLARYMQVLSPDSSPPGLTGSSTSTTRFCRRSRARGPTTRPTSAARSSPGRLLTTSRQTSTTVRSSTRT